MDRTELSKIIDANISKIYRSIRMQIGLGPVIFLRKMI